MKLSVPTLGRLATLGFVKEAGMNSLFRHPSLPWALFKRVNTPLQAIACGGVFTSNALTGTSLGIVTIVMGQTARYMTKHGLLGSVAVTGSVVARGVNDPIPATSRYTPGGQDWWASVHNAQLTRMSPAFAGSGAAGFFLAVITKAVDGCVTNINTNNPDFNPAASHPTKVVPDPVSAAVGKRGLGAGVPAQYLERNARAGVRSHTANGWGGYIDGGAEIRMGELLRSRFEAWKATIKDSAAREAMADAFVDEHDAWTANGKNDELHMLINRAYIRIDGRITGSPPDIRAWAPSARNQDWFLNFNDRIAEGWDAARTQIATSMNTPSPMLGPPRATGMPAFSGFLDGTPLKAMDSLLPIANASSGTYPADATRPEAGFVVDASGEQVSLFTAMRGVLNFKTPPAGPGKIDFGTLLAEAEALRGPLVYQKTAVSVTDDSLDAVIDVPADMGLNKQREEARNALAVAEMLRRAYDPLIGRVTEFDSRVHAKVVGAGLGDENLTYWVGFTMPGRVVVPGPATDVVVLDQFTP